MIKYILRRISLNIPVVIAVTVLVFTFIHFIPGDPVQIMFGKHPDPEAIERVRKIYNLDKPVYVQYISWIIQMVKLDLGESILTREPVSKLILERLPRTLFLSFEAILISLLIGIPLAVVSAKRHNSPLDMGISAVSLTFISIPEFWFGILLILFFAVFLQILPATGYSVLSEGIGKFLKHTLMPALSLGLALSAVTTRVLRSELIENLSMDYILLAKVKGAKDPRVMFFHAFKNALIPTITVVGMQFAYLLGGEVVIESVFAYPGLGLLLIKAIFLRDYPIIQAVSLIFAVTFIAVNFLTDILYAFINPKIRYE